MELATGGAVNQMSILVLNAGSSTLKYALFDDAAKTELAGGVIDWHGSDSSATFHFRTSGTEDSHTLVGSPDYRMAVNEILDRLTANGFDKPVTAVGHRIVHGGPAFNQAVLIDDRVREELEQISTLAPLHNPPALAAVEAARKVFPDAVHIAVFDTAFYSALPRREVVYPLPYQWFEEYGIRRYGFHGISHAYCAKRAAEILEREDDSNLRLIICHLGNGCSATAVRGEQPVATTMGFTPLEGLMMGTRSGSIDPGILLHLMEQHHMKRDHLDEILNRQSGLLGISGVSSDFREVEQSANAGHKRASLAIEMFATRIRSTIGAFAVTLGGIDALIFTAGIGEHSRTLRSRVCAGLQSLNVLLDEDKNQERSADSDIAQVDSTARILVIRTREEQDIAHAAQRLREESS
ncbi:acetate kinase [Gimesia benthica]|uniref:Acetate kinase n=1 Tax=Gimesia benthica TaxID=2608982 RepID=A0A6I6AAF3_9PLAN|nr:acetate kinase [Gimesia benthica]QGQ22021.1 acetate kinase [Gimesia benthica]